MESKDVEQHRRLLFAIAYRMLGTVSDAEDMVQEAFLRWHKEDRKEVASPKAYLAAAVTRLCINQLQSARVRREEYTGPWLPEPLLTTEMQEDAIADSVSMSFLILLENLSPAERAVFLLRKVFDYEFSEIAAMLNKSEASCRQLLHRAKQHLAARPARFKSSRSQQEKLVNEFLEASRTGNVEQLLRLIAEDATFISDGGGKVAAALNPIYGADKIVRFLLGVRSKFPPKFESRVVEMNGQPAILNLQDGTPHSAVILDVQDDRITNIYAVSNPDKLTALRA